MRDVPTSALPDDRVKLPGLNLLELILGLHATNDHLWEKMFWPFKQQPLGASDVLLDTSVNCLQVQGGVERLLREGCERW